MIKLIQFSNLIEPERSASRLEEMSRERRVAHRNWAIQTAPGRRAMRILAGEAGLHRLGHVRGISKDWMMLMALA